MGLLYHKNKMALVQASKKSVSVGFDIFQQNMVAVSIYQFLQLRELSTSLLFLRSQTGVVITVFLCPVTTAK